MNLGRSLGLTFLSFACLSFLPGCGDDEEGTPIKVMTPKGEVVMHYVDLQEGKGEACAEGDRVVVYYTAKLTSGKVLDSNVGRTPRVVHLGAGQGWDKSLPGMKVGGKRKLIIPPELAYGEGGAGKSIAPNSKLIYEVEMMRIAKAGEDIDPDFPLMK